MTYLMRNSCFSQGRVTSSWEQQTFSIDTKEKYKRTFCHLSVSKGSCEIYSNRKICPKTFKWRESLGPVPLFLPACNCAALLLVFWQQLGEIVWIIHISFYKGGAPFVPSSIKGPMYLPTHPILQNPEKNMHSLHGLFNSIMLMIFFPLFSYRTQKLMH